MESSPGSEEPIEDLKLKIENLWYSIYFIFINHYDADRINIKKD